MFFKHYIMFFKIKIKQYLTMNENLDKKVF